MNFLRKIRGRFRFRFVAVPPPRAKGSALDALAASQFGAMRLRRRERLPWIGDWFFRRRLRALMRWRAMPPYTFAWLVAGARVMKMSRIPAFTAYRTLLDGMPIGTSQDYARDAIAKVYPIVKVKFEGSR